MLVSDNVKLLKNYICIYEEDETGNNDFNAEDLLDYADTFSTDVTGYYNGVNPHIQLTPALKKLLYKIDIGNVTPGSLSQQGLVKAYKTIKQYVPRPWQYRIQYDINLPVTLKIGRNTLIKNFPAYVFDFGAIEGTNIVPPMCMDAIKKLYANFNLTPEKVYIYMEKIPFSGEIDYSMPINRDMLNHAPGNETFIIIGKSQTGKPFAINFTGLISSSTLYGPKKSYPLKSFTVKGGLLPFMQLIKANHRQQAFISQMLVDGTIKSIKDIPNKNLQTQFKYYLDNKLKSTGLNE